MNLTKSELKDTINKNSETAITFLKKDGSRRTLNVIPWREIPAKPLLDEPVVQKERKPESESLLKVYDINDGWRTIIIESIQNVETTK